MRTILAVAFAALVAVTIWWTFPTHARPRFDAVSVDPLNMTITTSNLPHTEYYDQSTIFPISP